MTGEKKTGLGSLSSLIKDVESAMSEDSTNATKNPGSASLETPAAATRRGVASRRSDSEGSNSKPSHLEVEPVMSPQVDKKTWPKIAGSLLVGVGIGAGLLFLLQQQGIAASGGETHNTSSASSADIQAVRQELETVKTELAALKKGQAEISWDNMMRDFERVAFMRPGDEGYSAVRFDLGVLTVSLADITPYANGTKVRLQFGNPLSSTVNGLKATVEVGSTDQKGVPDNANVTSKEVTFTESLRPGAWTTVSVVLDGVKPTDLGFVRVKDITHTGIALSR